MSHIDLHLHSTSSDGVLSPSAVVAAAADAGLSAIALCDHDTVLGVDEAIAAGTVYGIRVLAGVELSVAFQEYQDVHLLGYGIDQTNRMLLDRLEAFARRRANRNREIIVSINRLLREQQREPLEIAEVEALAGGVLGRPHIARALMARGYVADMEQAFERYLVPCNVPKYYWPMEEALQVIRQVGGVAVLAHPTSISWEHLELERIITALSVLGLDGIEVYNSMASESDTIFLQRLANKLGLLVTGGSDFHGIDAEDRIGKGRGGIRFPETLLPPLLARTAQRQAALPD